MTISRSLSLIIKLSGATQFKSQILDLQSAVTKLQQSCSNITLNANGVNNTNAISSQIDNTIKDVKIKRSSLNNEIQNLPKSLPTITSKNNMGIGSQIDNTIKDVKIKGSALKKEMQRFRKDVAQTGTSKIIPTNINNIKNTDILKQLPIITSQTQQSITHRVPLQNIKDQLQNFDNTKYKTQTSYPTNTFLNSIDTNTFKGAGKKQAVSTSSQYAVEAENKIVALKAQQLKQGQQMAAQFNKMNNDRKNQINQIYKAEEEKLSYIQQKSKQLFQTGFGLHIVQMYIAPVLYALEQISAKMIDSAAQFDKKFTSYMVKSESYGENLSKEDFYTASVGQTYGIQDAAIAAERYAASGVDVAKSQAALTSVMQVATSAQMDYADAANGVIKTMQAMHMEVQDTTIITDALINSANASTAELGDLVQWFEYAASSAYQAGLNVQQLSAYLGILASSGTPNTGAAMRQLFLQVSKEDIQANLTGAFDWIKPEDFANMDQLILKMRQYVQTSDDQKAAVLSITRLLGGKANAQQALNNLLVAEPELWNQLMSAVKQTGSTQDLYNKITNNTSDAIQRIKVNIEILLTQLGQYVGPVIGVISKVFTAFTNAVVSLPSVVKGTIGVLIILSTIFVGISFIIIGVVGALAIMAGTVSTLAVQELTLIGVTGAWSTVIKKLIAEIYTVSFAGTSLGNVFKSIAGSATTATAATNTLTASQSALRAITLGISGAFIGYMVSSSAMQKQMYTEAYMVGHLTALWLAYSAARAASVLGPVAAGVAAMGAFAGYEAIMYSQIETMKRDARLSSIAAQTGTGSSTKNYNLNINQATISDEGFNVEDVISASGVDYDE